MNTTGRFFRRLDFGILTRALRVLPLTVKLRSLRWVSVLGAVPAPPPPPFCRPPTMPLMMPARSSRSPADELRLPIEDCAWASGDPCGTQERGRAAAAAKAQVRP